MPENATIDELRQIDTTAIEQLCEIKREQEVLQHRLAMMEEKHEMVSEAVYERVRNDYQSRHREFEDKARPLKTQARQEYATLHTLRKQIKSTLEAVHLDKEELEFRHELGEFDEEDFSQRLAACNTQLEERQAELAEAEQLKARFLAAFHSEEELTAEPEEGKAPTAEPEEGEELTAEPVGEEAPPAKPEPTSITAQREPSVSTDETIARMPIAGESGADSEQADRQRTRIVPRSTDIGKTVMMHGPVLVALREDGSSEEFLLGVKPIVIGRAPKCKIRLAEPGVSRQHAEVSFGPTGYSIRDLDSENGTQINGEPVTERKLQDGDLISIGSSELLFREE